MAKEVKKKGEACPFMKGYYNKDYLKFALEQMPVYILDNTDLGLDGCFVKAKEIIRGWS